MCADFPSVPQYRAPTTGENATTDHPGQTAVDPFSEALASLSTPRAANLEVQSGRTMTPAIQHAFFPPEPGKNLKSAADVPRRDRGVVYLRLGRSRGHTSIFAAHQLGMPDPQTILDLEGQHLAQLGWKPGNMGPFNEPAFRNVPGLKFPACVVWGGLVSESDHTFGWLGVVGSETGGDPMVWQAVRSRLIELETLSLDVPTLPAVLILNQAGEPLLSDGPAKEWLRIPHLRNNIQHMIQHKRSQSATRTMRYMEIWRSLNGPSGPATLLELHPHPPLSQPTLARLSAAQAVAAEFAAAGATVAEIAAALGRSPETVRTHIKRVYKALGVASRLELAEALAQDWT
jgi:DNA-binding CsgD family transcriptional regulator